MTDAFELKARPAVGRRARRRGRDPSSTAGDGAAAIGAPLLAVAGGLAFTQPSITGGDLWWHLAAGREIGMRGEIPLRDPFSHTADRDWLNHEWLWDVGAFSLFDVHPDLLAWVQVAALATLLALVYRGARAASASRTAALLACWAAAAASHWFIEIRPHLLTLLGAAAIVETRERRFAPWAWAPLIALWTNLHGGFLFGVGLIGLAALVPDALASRAGRRLVWTRGRWLGVAAAIAAIGLNPWGYAIALYPLSYLDGASYVRDLIEWQAPDFGLDPRDYGGRLVWLAALAAWGAFVAGRTETYRVCAAAVALVMACVSLRFIPLFAVLAAPLAARGLVALGRAVERSARGLVGGRFTLPFPGAWPPCWAGAALAAAVLWFWQDARLWPRLLDRWTEASMFPDAGVRWARALGRPGLRLFNENGWGGYISFHAPDLRIFYDGRANTVYGQSVADDYTALRQAAPGYRARLDSRGVEAVLLLPDAPLVAALRRDAPAWELIYASPREVLLASPALDTAGLPAAHVIEAGLPSAPLSQLSPALAAGDLRGALAAVERTLELDPLHIPAHRIAMLLHGRRLDRAALDAAARRALCALPRARVRLLQSQANGYLALGRRREAIALLRSAHDGGPTQLDDILALQIRRLEAPPPRPR